MTFKKKSKRKCHCDRNFEVEGDETRTIVNTASTIASSRPLDNINHAPARTATPVAPVPMQ